MNLYPYQQELCASVLAALERMDQKRQDGDGHPMRLFGVDHAWLA